MIFKLSPSVAVQCWAKGDASPSDLQVLVDREDFDA